MGCINSTKKLTDLKGDLFRVKVIRIQPENSSIGRYGVLELTKKELVFVCSGSRENVNWALQHLRRYGLNDDTFSFEAGRRCMSGPGIFTFRCVPPQSAERLYQIFQRNINAVSQIANEELFGSRSYEHPSHTLGRPDPNPHSNNYLEPAPMPLATSHRIQALQESFSSSPLSLLDSPDSVPSLSFTNEMLHFPSGSNSHQLQTPSTPGGSAPYVNSNAINSNLYSEHPLRSHTSAASGSQVAQRFFGSGSANSTLQRRTLIKHTSLDAPQECAPLPPPPLPPPMTPSGTLEGQHNYANIETGQVMIPTLERSCEKPTDPNERCYENLSRMDLPLLLQLPPLRDEGMNNSKENEQQTQQHQQQQQQLQQPTTPGGVNYIVLDLDQPRSPTQSSPKTCFGSGLSLITGERSESTSMDLQSPPLTAGLITTTSLKESEDSQQSPQQQQKAESSLGYSTIDFIKTCALIKSSTHGADFDLDPEHDAEESRITRHSKCVRKAYSISE